MRIVIEHDDDITPQVGETHYLNRYMLLQLTNIISREKNKTVAEFDVIAQYRSEETKETTPAELTGELVEDEQNVVLADSRGFGNLEECREECNVLNSKLEKGKEDN